MSSEIRAFDRIAADYDEQVLSNEILVWMREQVHRIFLFYFKPRDSVLELNAGTGIDAEFLSKHGINVYATDASERMIEKLRTRTKIHSEVLSFSDLNKIKGNFNGVISNFGGLNCINDFEDLSKDLYSKIKSGGKFIAVVMNKFCPWEVNYYLMMLKPRSAFRRFSKNGIDVGLYGSTVRAYYFTPRKFARSFKKNFVLEKIYSLGLFTPPPYLLGLYRRFKIPVQLLMKIDATMRGIYPFNRFGDHFIVVLRKKM